MYPSPIIVRPYTFSGDIMNNDAHFDVEEYRAELECKADDELFSENELAELAEKQMTVLVERYEEQLDDKDMSELYGDEEWERLRAAKIEERVSARQDAL